MSVQRTATAAPEPAPSTRQPVVGLVRDLYTRYPYPPPDRPGRHVALLGFLDYVRYVFWPGRPDFQGVRVLDAGCGTGEAVAQIAAWYPEIAVTGIDLSATSLQAARARADRMGVGDNLTLRQLPIEEVGALGQQFDYIISAGVIHHLADPAAGLAALASVLAPTGGIALMLYATYGRHSVYLMQNLLRRLVGGADLGEQAAFARVLLKNLPETNPFDPNRWADLDWAGDAGLVDLLLHVQDRPYTVPDIYELVAAAGLRLERFYCPRVYEPATYCPDPRLQQHFATLPAPERAAVAELLHGDMSKHMVFLTHPTYQPLRLEATGTLLLALRPQRSPLFKWNQVERKQTRRGKQRVERIVLTEVSHASTVRVFEFEAWYGPLFAACDGVRTASDIFQLPEVFAALPGATADAKLTTFGQTIELLAAQEVLLCEP